MSFFEGEPGSSILNDIEIALDDLLLACEFDLCVTEIRNNGLPEHINRVGKLSMRKRTKADAFSLKPRFHYIAPVLPPSTGILVPLT